MSLLPDDLKSGSGAAPAGSGSSMPPKPPAPPANTPPVIPPARAPIPPRQPVASAAGVPVIPKPPVVPPSPPVAATAPKPPAPMPQAPKAPEKPLFGSGLRVSLMPSDLISKSAPDLKKQLTILALVLVVETLVIGGAYLFMLRTVGNRTEEGNVLAQRRAELVAQLKKQEDVLRDAVLWNKQRKSATETLAQHVYWTDAFAFLESVTLPTVSFKSFSGDADTGIMTLDATAKSYRDLAEQIVLLRSKPQIFEVKTTAASAQISEDGTIEGVSFSLSMKVDPRVWHSRQ